MNSRFVLSTSRAIRTSFVACCILAGSTGCDSPVRPEEEPALPDAAFDQVGLPADYATTFRVFYVFDRPDNRQVRLVYANEAAAAGMPFRRGSILVMETWRAKQEGQVPVLDGNGRYQQDTLLTGIFVMRKERWFGRRYKEQQTGEWEYASFRANKTANMVGDASLGCAICHIDAGPARDWVYRANIHFAGASGALPQVPAGHSVEQPFIDSYLYLPATITVPVGTTVRWTNRDQVKHTVTATNGSFSGYVSQGAAFSRRFDTAGTFDYFCAIHQSMRGTVIVQ
jgi:plastocyanin